MFRWCGRMHNAHRIAWMLHTGSYPTDKTIYHTCDNPGCVNPSHLFEGTQQDNIADMVAKGRQGGPTGERNSHAKLNAQKVDILRAMYTSGHYTYQQLASLFCISKVQVGNIVRGDQWS